MMGLWLWSLDIVTPVCAVLLRTGIGIDREVKSLASSFGVWCSHSAGSNEIFFKNFSVILINLAFEKINHQIQELPKQYTMFFWVDKSFISFTDSTKT